MSIVSTRPWITTDQIDELTGEVNYGGISTQEDTLLQISTPAVVTTKVRITFPTDPSEGQLFGITTVRALEDVELYSQYYPIVGIITALAPEAPKLWSYSIEINKWMVHP